MAVGAPGRRAHASLGNVVQARLSSRAWTLKSLCKRTTIPSKATRFVGNEETAIPGRASKRATWRPELEARARWTVRRLAPEVVFGGKAHPLGAAIFERAGGRHFVSGSCR
ncbi:hypothetical protein NDU88_000236 [Pleurodeles waltl]|uniref:Uncharacterized protein n=1 Tax=Pleurodeles waltl TaxID=8319 RepID=A0AAV7LWU8_PLEWA|nr:hypothetical protein NDU88_000236 [Pleurodeles waltl]